jgi:hypothetical protein
MPAELSFGNGAIGSKPNDRTGDLRPPEPLQETHVARALKSASTVAPVALVRVNDHPSLN